MEFKTDPQADFGVGYKGPNKLKMDLSLHNVYDIRFRLPSNPAKEWHEQIHNLVTLTGKSYILNAGLLGASVNGSWFMGLVDNASFSAIGTADNMVSHTGWTESTAYSNSTRPLITFGSAVNGSMDNLGATSVFTINATASINGAFVASQSPKGTTNGTLYAVGSFSSAQNVTNGGTLNVTVTATA